MTDSWEIPADAQTVRSGDWRLAVWKDDKTFAQFVFYLDPKAEHPVVAGQRLCGHVNPRGEVTLLMASPSGGIRTNLALLHHLVEWLDKIVHGLKWREP